MPSNDQQHWEGEAHWEGDTDALVRRLAQFGPTARASQLRLLYSLAATTAIFLAIAAWFAWRAVQPPGFHVVSTGEDRIMWVNQRTGRAGACMLSSDRVRCVRADWTSGPLDYE